VGESLLASVVFLKLSDFARRSVTEQARLRAQLEAVIAVTTAELAPRGRVVLDATDGAAVVILEDPAGALRLAERALHAAAAGLPLAAGLNHGAVQVRGEDREARVEGDGIAVAAQAAGFAPPAELLASRAFRDALASAAPGREARLGEAGTFTDAGLRAHEFFRIDASAQARRGRRYALLGVLVAAGLVGASVAARVAAVGHDALVQRLEQRYEGAVKAGGTALRGWAKKAGL
jgi:hypothetical protein